MRSSVAQRCLFVVAAFMGAAVWPRAALGAPVVDPVALVTKEDVSAMIGAPILTVEPTAAEKDDDLGGTIGHCAFRGDSCFVVVSVITFPSSIEASARLTKQFVEDMAGAEHVQISAEPGLGERAFFAQAGEGIQFAVLRGAHIVAIGLAGKPPKAIASYRGALRTLTKNALVKLAEALVPKPQERPPPEDLDL